MEIIAKSSAEVLKCNLKNYEEVYESFSWDQIEGEITKLPQAKGINIAYEAVDRHVEVFGRGQKTAILWYSKTGSLERITYQDLLERSNRFANVLLKLGVVKGDSLFALCHRIPELYIGAFGAIKAQVIFSPLFAAFGPEPIKARMEIGRGRVLLTQEALYRRKVLPVRHLLPNLEFILITDLKDESLLGGKGVYSLKQLMENADIHFSIGPTDPEGKAIIHFTSGTTGMPKGAVHVHRAVISHHITGKYALDLHPDDVFWCTADPGWVTGTSYGIISPLSNGVTLVVDEGEFEAERWYRILQDLKVTVWYTAPTAIRMMMKFGEDLAKLYVTKSLRFIASVGEPLNPEAVRWGLKAFQLPIHDNWWQTETGGIMISNFASMDIKPGSMGRPIPGIRAKIVTREGQILVDAPTNQEGELALQTPWPSMFRAYLNQDERYRSCFTDGWYLSGDLAKKDADGYFWFIGRADDVIKSAGHLIGPFEVESALLEHPAVAEAAVIGKPDELLMEVVKVFVALKKGFSASEDLKQDIMGFARLRLGPVVAPKEIEFSAGLPKTRSGKIMRRLLRARELGLPEGDTSALETESADSKGIT